MMKSIFIAFLLTSSVAFAKTKYATGSPVVRHTASTLADTGAWSGVHNIYAKLVPYANGVGFAGAYERSLSTAFGWGGTVTVLPEKENATHPAVGLVSVMGNVFLHYPVEFVDFYVSPGVGLMMMELGNEDKTSLGASMAFGSLAQFNKNLALGIEFSVQQPWFNKEFFVNSRAYFMNTAITGRVSF